MRKWLVTGVFFLKTRNSLRFQCQVWRKAACWHLEPHATFFFSPLQKNHTKLNHVLKHLIIFPDESSLVDEASKAPLPHHHPFISPSGSPLTYKNKQSSWISSRLRKKKKILGHFYPKNIADVAVFFNFHFSAVLTFLIRFAVIISGCWF